MTQTRSADVGFHVPTAGRTGTVLPALAAMLLGLLVVGVVGFSHIDVLHSAAHDVRHANGFPCH